MELTPPLVDDLNCVSNCTDAMGAVESVKAASDIYAPVAGTITEVNEALGDSPGLLNSSAEEKGALGCSSLSCSFGWDKVLMV